MILLHAQNCRFGSEISKGNFDKGFDMTPSAVSLTVMHLLSLKVEQPATPNPAAAATEKSHRSIVVLGFPSIN